MKVKILLVFCISCFFGTSRLAAQQLEQGEHVLSPSFGIGGVYPVFTSVNSRTPLFGLSYEYGAFDHVGPGSIGIGGFLGYKAFRRVNEIGEYSFYEKLHYVIVGAKGAYHYNPFPQVSGLDPYAGLMLSLNIADYASNYSPKYQYLENKYRTYLAGTVYAGTRYFFTENIGAFAEVSFGTSFFTLGANFRF